MRIITVPMKDNPTTTVFVLVEAGSKYENKENSGISHFVEHMCFKGTKKRPNTFEISKELDGIGATYNAFTSYEYTGYYAKSDYKQFDNILDVVSDIYINSVFPEQEIEREKGVIVEEIKRYNDLPINIVLYDFYKLLYGDTPVGRKITGTEEIIKNIKRTDIIDYVNKHYVASATTVIIAGKINEKEVVKKVIKSFKNIGIWKKEEKEKVIENQTSPQVSVAYKDTEQTHIILGVRTFNTYNKYNTIVSVINSILLGGMSSRLFQKLREEMGICYELDTANDTFTDHGMFLIYAGVDTKRVKEAIEAILNELKKIKNELVSIDELNKTKQHMIGILSLSLESSNSQASYYGMQDVLRQNIKTPEDIIKEIKAVTAEEIKFVAERIFKDENLNLSILGKITDSKEFKDILHF